MKRSILLIALLGTAAAAQAGDHNGPQQGPSLNNVGNPQTTIAPVIDPRITVAPFIAPSADARVSACR